MCQFSDTEHPTIQTKFNWDQRQNQQEQHLQLLQQPSVKIPTMTHFWSSKSISFQSLVLWFYHLFVVDQSAWPQSHSKPAVHCFSKTILFCVDKSCLWFWITEVIQWGCLLLPTLCASTRPPFSPNTEHNVQYSLRTQVIIDHLLQWLNWAESGGGGRWAAHSTDGIIKLSAVTAQLQSTHMEYYGTFLETVPTEGHNLPLETM